MCMCVYPTPSWDPGPGFSGRDERVSPEEVGLVPVVRGRPSSVHYTGDVI